MSDTPTMRVARELERMADLERRLRDLSDAAYSVLVTHHKAFPQGALELTALRLQQALADHALGVERAA